MYSRVPLSSKRMLSSSDAALQLIQWVEFIRDSSSTDGHDLEGLKKVHAPVPKRWDTRPKRNAKTQNAAVQAMPVYTTRLTAEVACQTDAPVGFPEDQDSDYSPADDLSVVGDGANKRVSDDLGHESGLRGVASMRTFYDPPPMQYNTVHSLLLKEVTATNVYDFPSYVRDLGPLVQHLARRVIWDTDRGAIVADEVIHDQSMKMCLRDSLPVDVFNTGFSINELLLQ